MTHVVTDACIRCKYTDCVDVCPVDCFKEGPGNLLKVFSGIALECNRDEWMLRTRGMGPLPMQAAGASNRPISFQPFGQVPFRTVCGVAALANSTGYWLHTAPCTPPRKGTCATPKKP